MPSLAQQQCLNHSAREAVARCPECRHFFCRECIAEHDDRMICAACLRKLASTQVRRWNPWRLLGDAAWGLGGLLTTALFFYWVGRILLLIPTSFHDGALWRGLGGGE